jgi:hypothetical protein
MGVLMAKVTSHIVIAVPGFLVKQASFGRFPYVVSPSGYAMHQQFNIQQLYALPTLYLCVL